MPPRNPPTAADLRRRRLRPVKPDDLRRRRVRLKRDGLAERQKLTYATQPSRTVRPDAQDTASRDHGAATKEDPPSESSSTADSGYNRSRLRSPRPTRLCAGVPGRPALVSKERPDTPIPCLAGTPIGRRAARGDTAWRHSASCMAAAEILQDHTANADDRGATSLALP